MFTVLEIDAASGTRIERVANDEEQQKRVEIDQDVALREVKMQEETERRLAAIQHARSLGFTDEMIFQMFPALAT